MTTALSPADADWAALSFDDRKGAFGEQWQSFARRTLTEAWHLGRRLRSLKDEMRHGEFGPYLKALPPKRPAPEPKAAPAPKDAPPDPDPAPEPVTGDVLSEPEAEAAMQEVATEAEADTALAERERREERLAIYLENADGEAVDVLADKLDKARFFGVARKTAA